MVILTSRMVNTTSSAPPLPSYKRPPVIEVSYGTIFMPLSEFQTRHFGQFWAEQKPVYPDTKDLGPLFDVSGLGVQGIQLDMPPLRRMWCVSTDQQYVIQIQDSRVHLNWRRVKPEDEYPRYSMVSKKFLKLWADFSSFVEREKLGKISVTRYELVYVNHIELPSGVSVADSLEEHVKLFRFSPIQGSYLAPPESVNTSWKFAMPENRGTATASLSNATNQSGQNLLVLVFTCSGTPSEKYSETDWFQSAHEWIVRSFTELTTASAHQKWQREQ